MRKNGRSPATCGYQMRNDRFWRYRGGERNFFRANWSKEWPLKPYRSLRSSEKVPVAPAAVDIWPAEEARVISGNRSSVADTKSHGICCEDPEQQPLEERICSCVVWCWVIGWLRQQHFIPQPELAITPVAIKLAPKVRANVRQMALMSNLFPEATLFIVNQYTLGHFVMSTDINQKFDSGSPVTRSGDPWFGSLLIFYNRAHRFCSTGLQNP